MNSLQKSLFSPSFWALVVAVSVVAFMLMRSIQVVPLAFATLTDPVIPLFAGMVFSARILGASFFEFSTHVELVQTTLSALLIGINLGLIYTSYRAAAPVLSQGALGIAGVVLSTIGLGCAACSPFILTALATQIGAIGIVSLLPYSGAEIGYVGVALLAASTLLLAHTMSRSSCPV